GLYRRLSPLRGTIGLPAMAGESHDRGIRQQRRSLSTNCPGPRQPAAIHASSWRFGRKITGRLAGRSLVVRSKDRLVPWSLLPRPASLAALEDRDSGVDQASGREGGTLPLGDPRTHPTHCET